MQNMSISDKMPRVQQSTLIIHLQLFPQTYNRDNMIRADLNYVCISKFNKRRFQCYTNWWSSPFLWGIFKRRKKHFFCIAGRPSVWTQASNIQTHLMQWRWEVLWPAEAIFSPLSKINICSKCWTGPEPPHIKQHKHERYTNTAGWRGSFCFYLSPFRCRLFMTDSDGLVPFH